ncbi:hypothetical protein [Frankia sp. CIT1]|uniref:hypothetical protein n=1 Tax=Frankia sp. CIT1 TaxID=2880974 RepID=UPI001EF4E4D1|nr:hypothetical protein [Frankia sp. CIT1]
MSIKIGSLDGIAKLCKRLVIIVCRRDASEEHQQSMPQPGVRPVDVVVEGA